MRKLSIITVSLITSSLLLVGCGGEGTTANEIAEAPVTITPPSAPETQPPTVSPDIDTNKNSISLVGIQAKSQIQVQKVKGELKPEYAIVAPEFSNATGEIIYKGSTTNAIGNLTFGIKVDEPDQINEITLYLPDVKKSYSLCSTDCGTSFQENIIGYNPQLSGLSEGTIRIELFVTDSQDNTAMLDAQSVNWRPMGISAITSSRENGILSISWEGESSLNRYNFYAATEPNLTPTNALSLENGTQQLALKTTNVNITDLDTSKNYYVLITSIDENGQSGLGVPIKIASTLIISNQPPYAVNDIIELDEDTSINTNIISNDVDPENSTLTLSSIVTRPANGVLTSQSDGQITYTPNANFHGKDIFTYEIIDDENNTSKADVSITVKNVNDAPAAKSDSFNLEIDNTLTTTQGALIANDFDLDGDFLFVEITPVTQPLYGTLQLNSDGSFIYTDNGSFVNSDSFQYKVTDNKGGTSVAEVTLLTSGQDITPVAVNDAFEIDEDTTLIIELAKSILSNDTDPNNLTLTLSDALIKPTTHGQLNLAVDGTFTYIPNTNYYGIDSFQYEIENTLGEKSQAYVSITVNSVADIPTANNDSYQTDEDITLNIDANEGLLTNDSDTDGGSLTVNLSPVVDAQQGSLSLNADGSFSYTPNNNFYGLDTFTYQIINNKGNTTTAQASITINSVNDAPAAVNDQAQTNSETQLIVDVLLNDTDIDGDELTVKPFSLDETYGTVTVENNKLRFIPSATFGGLAEINYTISDPSGEESSATASISVNVIGSLNVEPIAINDTYTLNEDEILIGSSILNNDTDSDGGVLTVSTTPFIDVTNGTLIINTDGTFIYTPDANYNGTDSFSYRLSDGQGGFNTAQVTLTINAINDIPVAVSDSYTMLENTSLTVIASDFNALLVNDSDDDIDPLNINVSASTNTSFGNLILHADGEFTYTPNADYIGEDNFNYQLEDDNGGSITGSVSIIIKNVNAAPHAVANNYSMLEGTVLYASSVLENDTDIDGDNLTVDTTFTSSPSNGNVVFNSDGTFTYTPNTGFYGADSFTYMVEDGHGEQDEGLINITILLDPDAHGAPIALTDNFSVDEDTTLFESSLLANDSSDELNVNDKSLLLVSTAPVQSPNHGTLVLQSNGAFTYTPNDNFYGDDYFEYKITNIYDKTATARVNLIVKGVNDAPVAVDDHFTIEKNSGKFESEFLLNNDSDPENSHLDITETPIVNVKYGTLTLSKHGKVEYTPETDFIGTDSFVYELTDEQGATDLATVTIIVTEAADNPLGNLPPTALDDAFSINKNSGKFTYNFALDNDSDPEGEKLELNKTPVKNVEFGTLKLNKNGKIEYTPNTNYVGTDSFIYQVVDESGNTDQATVVITIINFNTAPKAVSDTYTISEGSILNASSVLDNDTDVDNDTLTIDTSFISSPSNGSIVFSPDGRFVYTPNAGFFGADSFLYQINDGKGKQDQGTVNIAISANPSVRGNPLAITDSYNMGEDTVLNTFNLLDNDLSNQLNNLEISPLIVTTTPVVPPENGILVLQSNGTFTYTPNTNFSGYDSFEYEITNIYNKKSTAIVTINVSQINDTPIALPDSYTMDEDTVLNGESVFTNDIDVDGDPLSIDFSFVSSPSNGTVVFSNNGTFVYTPNADFFGIDTFSYKALDTSGISTTAIVTINVNHVNTAPIAIPDTYTTDKNDTLNGTSVLANDTDIDGDTLTLDTSYISSPLNGNVTFNNDGTFVYTPNSNYVGSDLFSYKTIDNHGGESEGFVNITIEPKTSLILQPFARDDYYTVKAEKTLNGSSILDNDDAVVLIIIPLPLDITSVKDVEHGTLVLNSNGEFTYTPNDNFIGKDTFIYSIKHTNYSSSTAIVHITVTEDN